MRLGSKPSTTKAIYMSVIHPKRTRRDGKSNVLSSGEDHLGFSFSQAGFSFLRSVLPNRLATDLTVCNRGRVILDPFLEVVAGYQVLLSRDGVDAAAAWTCCGFLIDLRPGKERVIGWRGLW